MIHEWVTLEFGALHNRLGCDAMQILSALLSAYSKFGHFCCRYIFGTFVGLSNLQKLVKVFLENMYLI